MKVYDSKNGRLVYFSQEATSEFWDTHWHKLISTTKYQKGVPKLNTAVLLTRKYLPQNSVVLEGGCGLAMTSWYLTQLGYQTLALDYADATIDFLNKTVPQVNPFKGDVRDTKLDNSSIDGYWSFGVIEHFWDGYDDIIIEANRVLKDDGYLFLTFPQLSLLRKFKAKIGKYEILEDDQKDGFYQFALDPTVVKETVEKYGFCLAQSISIGGMKGLKDEVSFLKHSLQRIYDSKNPLAVIVRKSIDILLSWFCGHTKVMVFKKKSGVNAC